MYDALKGMTREAGRDPSTLGLIVRANVEFSETPLGTGRSDFAGTLDEIAADVKEARRIGVAELQFDVQFSPDIRTTEDIVRRMEQLRQLANRS